jgi:hypothetical protein
MGTFSPQTAYLSYNSVKMSLWCEKQMMIEKICQYF